MPKHIKAPPAHPAQPPVVHFTTRQHYGRTDRYIADSPLAFAFKQLTGRTVLTDGDIASLRMFGVQRFEDVSPAVGGNKI